MTPAQESLARALVRLYPRAWRARYEDEVRALLSETTITPAVVFDVLRGAAREWIREVGRLAADRPGFRALCELTVSTTIFCVGLAIALWLRAHVDTPPAISYVDGQRSVLPPRIPAYLAMPWCLLQLAITWTEWRAWRQARRGQPVTAWNLPSALLYIAALAITTPLAMWFNLVSHYGTGLPASPVMSQLLVAMFTLGSVRSLFGGLAGATTGAERAA